MQSIGQMFLAVLNLQFVPKGQYRLSYGGLLLIAMACIAVINVIKFFFDSWGDSLGGKK